MQFSHFSLNFLNHIKVFSLKLKLRMVCFIGVIDIILMSILIKITLFRASRNLTKWSNCIKF